MHAGIVHFHLSKAIPLCPLAYLFKVKVFWFKSYDMTCFIQQTSYLAILGVDYP